MLIFVTRSGLECSLACVMHVRWGHHMSTYNAIIFISPSTYTFMLLDDDSVLGYK